MMSSLGKAIPSTFARACHSSAAAAAPLKEHTASEILSFREKHCARALSVQFRSSPSGPLKIVRGRGPYLYDPNGREYLDCVNNVCQVGHCHPKVLAAASAQMHELNTNTRFLHDGLVNYIDALLATMPAGLGLDTVFLVNSGTEANDLALRLAMAHTKRKHMVVVDHAYHGHSAALIDVSPYKIKDQGGQSLPSHVSAVPMPDVYRGAHTVDNVEGPERKEQEAVCAKAYVADTAEVFEGLAKRGVGVAAFWAESMMGVGGQVIPPDGWLAGCHEVARAHGALCIADEVQVGFGRVGTHWWAFEAQGGDVRPDIVTLGKPIGNGHPMAAVVTTKAIANSFSQTGMEYFVTFGGNPVSCATGLAVLDVVREEKLMDNARETGEYFCKRLRALRKRHPVLGDVRAKGLFVGVDLVDDPETREPFRRCGELCTLMKERGVLITTDGPHNNVLKIKPPIVFDEACVDTFCVALEASLDELEA